MITLKNQLVIQFNLGQFSDFISLKNFKGMQILENAGGLRPILSISFILERLDLIPYLNQGNIISVRYGIKYLNEEVLQFEIQGDNKTKQYNLGSMVTLLASYYNPAFTSVNASNTYTGKSYEVLQQICDSVSLKFTTNVQKTNDKQNWCQDGKTLWEFTSYIGDRAYKDDTTFFTYAFDCNNFYFYNMKDHINNGPKWFLSVNNGGKDENSPIVNIGSYFPDDTLMGQLGQMAGKNVTTIGYNVDTGEFSYPEHKLKTFTTLQTTSLNINATGCQNYNYMITSGKDHENTLQAINQNKRNNTLFSSFVVRVPVPGQFRNFKLLDVVQLIPAERDDECYGYYIISGITRQFANNMYTTNLTLNRESANSIRGDLVQGE